MQSMSARTPGRTPRTSRSFLAEGMRSAPATPGRPDLNERGAVLRESQRSRMTVLSPVPPELEDGEVLLTDALVDSAAGYCLVFDDRACYAWPFRDSTGVTRFSLPWHCNGAQRRLAGLWPHSFGSTALVVCSPTGALCFWEAVSNPERCLTAQLDLSPDDTCQQLVCVEPVGFAVLTRLGRVFLVLQPFADGVLEIRQLTRPASSLLSRVTSLLSYAAGAIGGLVAAADASVVCVAAGARRGGAERDLFLLTETSLQHWELSTRRPSRLVSERSLNDAVAAYISQSRPSSPAASALLHSERALLDMQVTVGLNGSEVLVLLCALAGATSSSRGKLCLLCVGPTLETVSYAGLLELPSNLPGAECRLVAPAGGVGAFVVAPSGCILTSIEPVLQDNQALQCVEPDRFVAAAPGDANAAVLLSQRFGMVELQQLDLTPGYSERSMQGDARRERYQSMLKYALFTDVHPGVEAVVSSLGETGDWPTQPDQQLDAACEDFVREMVAPRAMTAPVADISLWLQRYINSVEQIVFGLKLPLADKTHASILVVAERLKAALELWLYSDPILKDPEDGRRPHRRAFFDVLGEVMPPELRGLSRVRQFFYNRPLDVVDANQVFSRLVKRLDPSRSDLLLLQEVNTVVIGAVEAAQQYRQSHYARIPSGVAIDWWSNSPDLIDVLEKLLSVNEAVCRAEAPRGDSEASKWYERGAKALLVAMQQRLAYLQRSAASGAAPAMVVEARMLEERFASTRHRLTKFIQQDLGHSAKAQELAREFHDFASLVVLVLSDKADARQALDDCIRQYGRDFAFELFDHFVRTGKRHRLFESPPFAFLDAYLEVPRDELADIAWLHDLRLMGAGRLTDPAMGALRLVHAASSTGTLPGRQHALLLARLALATCKAEQSTVMIGCVVEGMNAVVDAQLRRASGPGRIELLVLIFGLCSWMRTVAASLNALASVPAYSLLVQAIGYKWGFQLPAESIDALWTHERMANVWKLARQTDFPTADALVTYMQDHFTPSPHTALQALFHEVAKRRNDSARTLGDADWAAGLAPPPLDFIDFPEAGDDVRADLAALYDHLARQS